MAISSNIRGCYPWVLRDKSHRTITNDTIQNELNLIVMDMQERTGLPTPQGERHSSRIRLPNVGEREALRIPDLSAKPG